jgi:hypothetical protein
MMTATSQTSRYRAGISNRTSSTKITPSLRVHLTASCKGVIEASVHYVKRNALAGRSDELVRFEDYVAFAPGWRDEIANVRTHKTTR